MLVEFVGGQTLRGRRDAQLRTRHEPQQIAFAATVGTVALQNLRHVAIDFKSDLSAVAATLLHGRAPSSLTGRAFHHRSATAAPAPARPTRKTPCPNSPPTSASTATAPRPCTSTSACWAAGSKP
ncbi:hypothetical protein G6F57_015966 [Rhizopus arrhizus]|nr:hypothetical protein G6F57_015966 [Rhizopus arrhizus]